jgi:hypothetical protein
MDGGVLSLLLNSKSLCMYVFTYVNMYVCTYNLLYCSLSIAEVERLLRDYPSNQELVRSIGAQYYQFVNVAQIRHHQIMGLSTREGTSKAPRAQAQVMQGPQQPRVSYYPFPAEFCSYDTYKVLFEIMHECSMCTPIYEYVRICTYIATHSSQYVWTMGI